MAKLMTSSLINDVEWLKKCPPNWKEIAFKGLHSRLARDYDEEMPHAVKRGIDLENMVYKVLGNELVDIASLKCSKLFKDVLNHCKGGIFQQKTKSFIEIDGVNYCLYGKKDVSFPEKIVDIKCTGLFKTKSKYLSTIQHKIYCYNDKIKDFEYLVCVMNNDDKLIDIITVDYHADNFKEVEDEIVKRVRSTIEFLKLDAELYDLYINTFNLYN